MGQCFDDPEKYKPFASKNDIFEYLDVTNCWDYVCQNGILNIGKFLEYFDVWLLKFII